MKLQINIARNIGSKPMNIEKWNRFKTAVFNAPYLTCENVKPIAYGEYFCHVWKEESYFTLVSTSQIDKDTLKQYLYETAKTFHQDSIALTITEDNQNELIETK